MPRNAHPGKSGRGTRKGAKRHAHGGAKRRTDGGAKRHAHGGAPSRRVRDQSGRAEHPPAAERLQKVLSRAGVASRREVEDWIRAGRVTVNGQPASLGVRVTLADHVALDGRLIRQRAPAAKAARVFLCHRSPGQDLRQPDRTADQRVRLGEKPSDGAMVDRLPRRAGPPSDGAMADRLPRRAGRRFIAISPMPRIDGGLELLTSDGELAAQLQRVVHGYTSEFSVRVRGELNARTLEGILSGALDSGETIEVQRCEPSGGEGINRWYALGARGASGKEVRQLFERHGALVSRVLRTQLGPLTLDRHLARGQFRELQPAEWDALRATIAPETVVAG